jgi:type I restriction enzyme S subunit
MTSDWSARTLGELIDIQHGYAFKGEYFRDTPPGDILLTPGNFAIGGGFRAHKLKFYNGGPVPESFVLNEGDLLITMTDLSKAGDTLGYPLLVPAQKDGVRFLHNQRLGKVAFLGNDVLKRYLYHLLRMPSYRLRVVAGASGTTVKHTSPTKLKAIGVRIPEVDEQRSIICILDGLDGKRLANLRAARALADIAQTLLRAEFVDFEFAEHLTDSSIGLVPDGWFVSTLGELGAPHRDTLAAEDCVEDAPYIGLDVMPRGSTLLDVWGRRDEVTGATFDFEEGDILFGKLRPYFKKVGVALVDGSCSTEIIVTRPFDEAYWGVLLAHLSSPEFINHATAVSSGTRMPRSEWKSLKGYEVAVPPRELAVAATERARRGYMMAAELAAQNRVLDGLYWRLAPKLLSGDLRLTGEEPAST